MVLGAFVFSVGGINTLAAEFDAALFPRAHSFRITLAGTPAITV